MGDMADYYAENGIAGVLEDEDGDDYDPYWQSRDGRRTRVSEMGDVHLMNTILFLERRSSVGRLHPCYEPMIYEAGCRNLTATLQEMRRPTNLPDIEFAAPKIKDRICAAIRAFKRGK